MLALTVRLVVSLAIVVGLLILLARVGQKRFAGRSNSPLRVVHRQALSRSSAVAVVAVGSRILVLGTTDQQVRLLTELDPEELDIELPQDVHDPELRDEDTGEAEELLAGTLDESYEEVAARFNALAPRARKAPLDKNPAKKPVTTIAPQSQGRLAGSALSPSTWKQAFQVAASLGGRSR